MNFKYTEKWSEEILYLSSLSVSMEEDINRLCELIDIVEYSEDKKVLQTIMKCLINDMGGVEETFYEQLCIDDISIYFTVLFELSEYFLQSKEGRTIFLSLLNRYCSNSYTKKEWKIILNITKILLQKNDIEIILVAYKENKFDTYYDFPYPQFYELFQKLLKEKSND